MSSGNDNSSRAKVPREEQESDGDKLESSALASILQKKRVVSCLGSFITLRDVWRVAATSHTMLDWFLKGHLQSIGKGLVAGGESDEVDELPRLLVNIRGRNEFLHFFGAREAEEVWTMHGVSPISIILDYHDSLDGPMPTIINTISTLEWLDLGRSDLTGPIPENLGQLTRLRKLYLAGNQLSGTIPSSICDMVELVELSLAGNCLSGPIPAAIGNLKKLTYLCLRDNRLSGPIPESVGQMHALQQLWLNSNELSGPLPGTIGGMNSLRELYLNNNKLQGPLPASLGDLTRLEMLSLRRNQLDGPLPALGRLSSLRTLYLEKNAMFVSDAAVSSLCNLVQLREMNLQNNRFENKSGARELLICGLADCVVYM